MAVLEVGEMDRRAHPGVAVLESEWVADFQRLEAGEYSQLSCSESAMISQHADCQSGASEPNTFKELAIRRRIA